MATKKIDYTWRWNRVPQYFVYHEETLVPSPFDARVVSIETSGSSAQIRLSGDNGEEQIFTVDPETLKVSQNEDLFAGDYGQHCGSLRQPVFLDSSLVLLPAYVAFPKI